MPAPDHMRLMIWLSPSFPVGAFAYSHALEWAHESGDVVDAVSLGGWIADLLRRGAPRNDPLLLAAAYRAMASLAPLIADTALAAEKGSLDDLGGAAFRSDLGAILHETQYSRLFRS